MRETAVAYFQCLGVTFSFLFFFKEKTSGQLQPGNFKCKATLAFDDRATTGSPTRSIHGASNRRRNIEKAAKGLHYTPVRAFLAIYTVSIIPRRIFPDACSWVYISLS